MSEMKYQANDSSVSIKLILPLLTRAVYRFFNCSLLLLKAMRDERE